mgnify:CR=1 FL=1
MMKHSKRFLCLLLTLILAASLCVFPAAAADQTCPSSKDDPVVFVHGLFGWGQRDKIFSIMPYWGMTTGSLPDYLATQGYETYAASVGPLSSAWDRACELYAQLVGARTDYGVKHAQDFGHERYGIDYETPLFEGWGTQRAVNLVGHSFGGATTRLFLEILTNGCPEEVAAAKAAGVAPSPFFLGGKGSWVHSLTAIAAPHNGTTFIEANSDFTKLAANLATGAAKALGLSSLKGVYDFQLDQFGIRRDPDEPLTTAALRMLAQNPLPASDNAFDDLRPAGARALNARIETLPDTWYFSIPCCRTLPRLLTHDQKPDTAMTPLLWPFSTAMGRDGAGIPCDWLPNDGLVNTISARYPGGAPHADFVPGQTPVRGVWQVLPVEHLDHLAAIGGVMNNGVVRTRLFYRRVMALLDAAAAADANS